MFKQIVIKPVKLVFVVSVFCLGLVACGQKGPLQPQPMPEQNNPDKSPANPTETVTYEAD
ncbi:MAG: LPS translocon maturation chaperone LptM [Pseudomonadota bacterium]